jgi:hypothetical protein
MSSQADPAHGFLASARVFPGTDGASPALLDVQLASQLRDWRAHHPGRQMTKRLVLHKARRRLDVFAGTELLKVYLVNLGYAPVGAKETRGDMKTPEGHLFICSKNRQSQFLRFLELAYPRPEDAERGVAAHLIGPSDQARVVRAYQSLDRCPPQQTELGGEVGIHGHGNWRPVEGGYEVVDWTWGCVGLRDADILELYDSFADVGLAVDVLAD